MPPTDVTAEDIQRGARLIPKNTTIGADHWETRELRALDDDAAEGFAKLLTRIEEEVAWPIQTLINLIVLMGKPKGGVRPIALMTMLYRLWSKIRGNEIRQWEELHKGPWDAAIRGSSALRAAVLGAFFSELHTLNGDEVAALLWDMDKFYDSIDVTILIGLCRDKQYPLHPLVLGMKMHMALRVLKVDDGFQPCELPSNGIIAGCLQSTRLTKGFLYGVCQRHCYAIPDQKLNQEYLRSFVDDLAQLHAGQEDQMVVDAIAVGAALAQDLINIRCRISPKSTIVGKPSIAKRIQRGLALRGIQVKIATEGRDLGVGTTAGIRRTSGILKQRIASARGRTKRIKLINRINKNAGKLFNSGSWPQASYGKEAMGVTPGDIKQLRTMAADAVTGDANGKCPTTAIWLCLGEKMDPIRRAISDQINMWFATYQEFDPILVSKAWWAQKVRFETSPSPWSTVKGPIGATIGTLKFLGWIPITPYKWVDPTGQAWEAKPGAGTGLLLHEMRMYLDQAIWVGAANHRCGQGLQVGADLSVLRKHRARLIAKGLNREAGMLVTVATGGVWTRERLHEVGKAADDICPVCGEGKEDELHMYWQCCWLSTSEHPEIKNSQYLQPRAEAGASEFPCFYMRGITPRDWTWREPIIPEICSTIDVEQPSRYDSSIPVFLDGPGGVHSSDKRVRSCGWAWIQVIQQDPIEEIGQYGPIPGEQTVPNAEAAALLHFLKFLNENRPGEAATIYADATSTIYGWRSLRRKAAVRPIWDEIRAEADQMDKDGTTIQILKVHSHPERPRKRFPNGIDQEPWLTFGNDRADHWADKGAKIHCLGEFRTEYQAWVDATATIIQKRLLKIMELRQRQRKSGLSLVVVQPNEIDERINKNGHDFVRSGSFYQCIRCCQQWHYTKRRIFSTTGICPGPGIWGIPDFNPDIPRKLVQGYQLFWAGGIVHYTHRLGYIKGLLFCWGCGAYASKRVDGLANVCNLKPKSKFASTALNNIRKGRYPDPKGKFGPTGSYPPPPHWLSG